MDNKHLLTKLLIAAFMLSFSWTTAIAQSNGIKIIDIQADRNYSETPCQLKFVIEVNAANLEQTSSGLYVLPTDMPPLYINYTLGNILDKTEAVQSFNASFLYNQSPIPVFTWLHQVSLGLNEICVISNGELDFKAELRTATGEPYPILNFATPGRAFECTVFEETCALCSNECNLPLQNSAVLIDDFSQACKVCSASDDYVNPGILEPNPNDGTISPPNAYPNPFNLNLNLEFDLSEDAPVEILIFNTDGDLIDIDATHRNAGAQQKVFDTSNWPQGIYFITVNANGRRQHLQVIKS